MTSDTAELTKLASPIYEQETKQVKIKKKGGSLSSSIGTAISRELCKSSTEEVSPKLFLSHNVPPSTLLSSLPNNQL